MNPLETYQSDAVERPIFRRRLFWALAASVLLHLGIIYWFRQTQMANMNSMPVDRLVPRVFKLKDISIDEKLLDGSDKAPAAPKPTVAKPAIKPLSLPDERPVASMTEGKLSPIAPAVKDLVKPIASEKPVLAPSEVQTIERAQQSASQLMDQDLNSIESSLLKDQPAAPSSASHIDLPANPSEAAAADAKGMAAASGRLDKLLSNGIHSGDAPVTMPGGALFEFDKSDLRTAAIQQLRLLGELIKRNPEITFTIEGYTDSFGDPAYNLQLSQARAEAVRTWLVQNMDVDPAHIIAKGYGATQFLVAPKNVDMHSQTSIDQEKVLEQSNRRVEIKFQFPTPQ